jgi:hypothetical protein
MHQSFSQYAKLNTLSEARSMRPIYLDHNASTPVDPAVAEAIRPYLEQYFGVAAIFSPIAIVDDFQKRLLRQVFSERFIADPF